MGYDCSVTDRKGCNYCLRYKAFCETEIDRFHIDDDSKTLDVHSCEGDIIGIEINYCPICGKKLRRQVL